MKACQDGELSGLSLLAPSAMVACGQGPSGVWVDPKGERAGWGAAGSPGRQAEGRERRPLTAEQMLVIL